ncbi:MAG: hypothetical protein MZU97_02895 [Bacillus subtilis]|nr:hypothetical protein [Bacillus subtilis]
MKSINLRGYSSRSEGIRDAIRTYITYYKWMSDVKGEREGCHNHGLRSRAARTCSVTLTEIEHEYHDIDQSLAALARHPRTVSRSHTRPWRRCAISRGLPSDSWLTRVSSR